MSADYEADFYARANEQAALIRAGNVSATRETGLPNPTFPRTPPFTITDAMREDFWPE